MVSTVARSPRAQIALPCTLRRRTGSPIPAQTLVLGPRGMQVRSPRPLTLDETVGFELPDLNMRISGRARVLRQERLNVYALGFEGLPEPMTRALHALAVNAPPQPGG
jgi:hypothetical protein